MKNLLFLLLFFPCLLTSQITDNYAIVIHGGAGNIDKNTFPEKRKKKYIKALTKAVKIGEDILKNGGTSLDAVTQTIIFMENNPLFNSGKGAVLTNKGTAELDASIMLGKDLNAGAVGGVKTVKNPILAAIAVMEKSKHVMLSGDGADKFAKEKGLDIVKNEYFITKKRKAALKNKLKNKYGTVGCVALDKYGDIVAATSTGGMMNKKWGRIGDSPIIGAGTYANNKTCGISCTGHGEFFIRYAVAHDISAQMEYGGKTIQEAAYHTIQEKLAPIKGNGGIIGIDKDGNIHFEFNTKAMFRAYAKPGDQGVYIFKN